MCVLLGRRLSLPRAFRLPRLNLRILNLSPAPRGVHLVEGWYPPTRYEFKGIELKIVARPDAEGI